MFSAMRGLNLDFLWIILQNRRPILMSLRVTIMGKHDGFWFYTIGQRQGLGLAGGPWYVVDKDVKRNIVYISKSYYAPDKQRDNFMVSECNWLITPERCALQVKMRHGKQIYE